MVRLFFWFGLFFLATSGFARNFSLSSHDALIGEVDYISASSGDTSASLGQRYNIGVNAIIAANPGMTEKMVFSYGSTVRIAGAFLLPPLPHHGIVINLPEMRLYYYLAPDRLMTYPIGIGRIGKTIPIRRTVVVRKAKDPIWIPTPAIRQFNQEQGIDLPKIMPPGPNNPLGPYAIYLGLPTYLIHSTIFPESVGKRASFGCIRMHEADISQFFPEVKRGTPVEIIDMPNKVGWANNSLYLEAHPPLEERAHHSLQTITHLIQKATLKHSVTLINWPIVKVLAQHPDGVPHVIGVRLQ